MLLYQKVQHTLEVDDNLLYYKAMFRENYMLAKCMLIIFIPITVSFPQSDHAKLRLWQHLPCDSNF